MRICTRFIRTLPPVFSARLSGRLPAHKLHSPNAPLWKEKHVIPGGAGRVVRAQAQAESKERGAERERDEAPVTPRPGACEERGGAVPAEATAHTPPPAESGGRGRAPALRGGGGHLPPLPRSPQARGPAPGGGGRGPPPAPEPRPQPPCAQPRGRRPRQGSGSEQRNPPRDPVPAPSRLLSPPPPAAAAPRPAHTHADTRHCGGRAPTPPRAVGRRRRPGAPGCARKQLCRRGLGCAAAAPLCPPPRLGSARRCSAHAGATPAQKVREVARFAPSFSARLVRTHRRRGKGRGHRALRPRPGGGERGGRLGPAKEKRRGPQPCAPSRCQPRKGRGCLIVPRHGQGSPRPHPPISRSTPRFLGSSHFLPPPPPAKGAERRHPTSAWPGSSKKPAPSARQGGVPYRPPPPPPFPLGRNEGRPREVNPRPPTGTWGASTMPRRGAAPQSPAPGSPPVPHEGAAAAAPAPHAPHPPPFSTAGAGEAASQRPRCRPPTPPLLAPARPRASPRHYTRRPGRRGGLGHTPRRAGAEGACGSCYRGQCRLSPRLPPALTFAL
ncbi:basic salivary proline-rich protein 3-like [Heliangelus exortis]|uniref:basic salivary proline-rich protein 3-like n=1 Tax=Heliangelus exortis TaxID=472823 RepID=UPI003A91E2F6